MKIKLYILILYFFIFGGIANASVFEHPIKTAALVKEIPKMESISCKFKQEKIIKGAAKPILSNGNFRFVKNKGVYFETLYPIKSNTSYTNKDYKQINEIMQAVANKKYSKIDNEFNLFYEKNEKSWTLGLKPKINSPSSKFISAITIIGSAQNISKIVIDLKNGSKNTLWFITK